MVPTAGINTYSDFIEYKNHGFEDGELIRYSNNLVKIGGLDTDQDYYVIKINDDRFRLAAAGIGSTLSNLNYLSKQFVGMTSVGLENMYLIILQLKLMLKALLESIHHIQKIIMR